MHIIYIYHYMAMIYSCSASLFASCLASCFWYKDLEIHISNNMNLNGQNDVHGSKCMQMHLLNCHYKGSIQVLVGWKCWHIICTYDICG
jgi:hypothetical protein